MVAFRAFAYLAYLAVCQVETAGAEADFFPCFAYGVRQFLYLIFWHVNNMIGKPCGRLIPYSGQSAKLFRQFCDIIAVLFH